MKIRDLKRIVLAIAEYGINGTNGKRKKIGKRFPTIPPCIILKDPFKSASVFV